MSRACRYLTHIHVHADGHAVVDAFGHAYFIGDHGVPLAAALEDSHQFRRAVRIRIPTLAAQFAPADFGNVQLVVDDLDTVRDREAVTIVEATTKGWLADIAGWIVEKSLSGIGLVFQHVADRCEWQFAKPRQSVAEFCEVLAQRKERQRTRLRLDAVRRFETLIELIGRFAFGKHIVPDETTCRREVSSCRALVRVTGNSR